MAGEAAEQKKITDLVDMIYKNALTEQAIATAEAASTKNAPVFTIPGTDVQLTRDQYIDWYKAANKDERTAAIKNYEYAKQKGYTGSFEQFQDTARTSQQKNFQQARDEGYEGTFNQWMLDLAKAGATTIGDIVGRKEGTEDVERKSIVRSPEFAQSVTEDLMKNKTSWYSVEEADKAAAEQNITFEQAQQMVQKVNVLKEMDSRVRSAFSGQEVERRKDGWYVNDKLEVRNPYYGG